MNNNVVDDLNHLLMNKKLKFIKIESNSKETGDSKKSISVVKIPFLKDNNIIQTSKYQSNSIKRQIDYMPNYPNLRENIKSMNPFSDRGIINNTIKFLRNNK